jgi:hypothetical protein
MRKGFAFAGAWFVKVTTDARNPMAKHIINRFLNFSDIVLLDLLHRETIVG